MHFSFFSEGRESFFFAIPKLAAKFGKFLFLKYVMRYANQDHFADISEGKKT